MCLHNLPLEELLLLKEKFSSRNLNSSYVTQCMCVCSVSKSCSTVGPPCTVACQALPYMGFFRQEYRNELPFPPPGDLPNSGIEPTSPVFPALAGRYLTTEPPGQPISLNTLV